MNFLDQFDVVRSRFVSLCCRCRNAVSKLPIVAAVDDRSTISERLFSTTFDVVVPRDGRNLAQPRKDRRIPTDGNGSGGTVGEFYEGYVELPGGDRVGLNEVAFRIPIIDPAPPAISTAITSATSSTLTCS